MKTLTMSPENIWLQFFLWTWEADPNKLNVCKLWWGTVFLPVGFFIKNSQRPFHYFSPVAAVYLTCGIIPSLCLGENIIAIIFLLAIFCSMLYSYIRQEAIAIKCDLQEAKTKVLEAELKAKMEAGENIFSERTERILEIIFSPIFWLINLAIDMYERFYDTRPGEQIVGFLSLFYYFLKSVKQKACFLVKVE